ncbi:MAG TPA: alpha/beta hydrolase [Actinomycetota bacterium]|nr:alpha/beta hydrolase [Actinomycetota bacterium]
MPTELPPLQIADIGSPVSYREWPGPAQGTFVLLHGLGGSHLNWVEVAPALAGLGRVLAPDLPGFGRSPRGERGTRLMDSRAALSRFLDAVGAGPSVLAGNSMGGAIGFLEAAVEPDRVRGLIATSSVYPWARGGRPHPFVLGTFALYDNRWLGERVVAGRRRAVDPEAVVAIGLKLLTVDPGRVPPDVVRLQVDLLRETHDDPDLPASFVEAARSIVRYVRDPSIGRSVMDAARCPVLVIHGRQDRFVPAAFAEAALAAHPSWRGRILPRVGHIPHMEAPDRWLAEVAEWAAAEIR